MDAGIYGFTCVLSQASILRSNKDSIHALSYQRCKSNFKPLEANFSYSSEEYTSATQNRDSRGAPSATCTYSFEKNTSEIQSNAIRIAPLVRNACKIIQEERRATQNRAITSHKDDADIITECRLDGLFQQENLQANHSSSCASSSEADSLQIPNNANSHVSMARKACAKNQEEVGNCTDSGIDGMYTWENASILQKGCLPADDRSSHTSLSKKNIMDVTSRANTQTPFMVGADKKLQADDGEVANRKESGLDNTSPPESNALTEQARLLVKEEKGVETHNSVLNQPCVVINACKKNQVDDRADVIVMDSGFDSMASLDQDGLHAINPSDTPSLEKRSLEMQFRADKQVSNARNAGQEDGGGIVDILDRGPHSLRNLNAKEFRRILICLLQQDDIDLQQVFLIQAHVIERGLEQNNFLLNILMSMYRKVGSMEEAILIFNKMLYPSVVSWNAMISLLSENKLTDQAFQLYLEMRKQGFDPNQVTLITALSICTELAEGKVIHAYIRDHTDLNCTKLFNALICMYGKCGDVEDARAVFDNMQMRDVVSWNSILTAYSDNVDGKRSKGKEPIELFWQMQQESLQPDVVTLIAVLGSCAKAALLPDGISIHAYIIEHGFESSIIVGNALVNMYGKCRALDDTFVVFARLPKKTEASWNALITACSEQTQASIAFQVFQDMLDQGVTPNNITFLSMLGACAQPEALAVGKVIHQEISHSKFKSLVYINNTLINMYGKCGDLEAAQSVFDNMNEQNLVSWSTLIAAYCENGKGEKALELFGEMQHANEQPNEVVFLNLVTACCHAELLKEGTFFFTTMVNQYHIRPTLKHYNCMVDLLGRVGQLAQAEDTINQMPCVPDSQIWMTLLGACRVHRDAKRANRIAKHVLHLIPKTVPTCVHLP